MKGVNSVWHDISALLIAIIRSATVVSVETSRSIRTCLLFPSPRKESLTDRNCSLCFANADERNAVVFPAASCTLLLNSFHFPLYFLLLPSLHWRRFTLSCLPYVYLFSILLSSRCHSILLISSPSLLYYTQAHFLFISPFVYLSSSSLKCYFHLTSLTHHSWRLLYRTSYIIQIT